jgi:hypothetical protein
LQKIQPRTYAAVTLGCDLPKIRVMGHQLHQGVMRVDIGSAMIFHPINVFVQFTMTTLAAIDINAAQNRAKL